MRLSPGENQQVNHHTETVGNHHVIGMHSPALQFGRRVISTLITGDLTVESERNFAGIHHVAQKGNVVILPSFAGYYHWTTEASTRCLFLVLINQIYCYIQHYSRNY